MKWLKRLKRQIAGALETGELSIDFPKLMKRKDQVVQTLTGGVQHLLNKNKITLFSGEASIAENLVVTIGDEKIRGKDILLATGSKPFIPPIKGLDKVNHLTTDSFFDLKELPKSLAIIGGGVISIELAFAMAPLGTKVTIIEVAPDILLTEDPDARKIIKKQLQKKQIKTVIKAEIQEVHQGKVILADQEISFDTLLRRNWKKAEC